jgi:5-methylcytosine-specific restriction endonuclease McrA
VTRKDRRYPQTLRANRKRLELLAILAPEGKCAECDSTEKLAVDHVKQKDWDANKLSSTARVARYWREFKAGVPMQALCETCNGKKNGRDHRWKPEGAVEAPVPPPPAEHESHGGDDLEGLLSTMEEEFPQC